MKAGDTIQHVFDNSPYKALLDRRLKNQITQAEFDYELACGAYSGREEYKFEEFPDMPPDLREFIAVWRKKSGAAKEKLRERILKQRDVQFFLDEYQRLLCVNKGRAYWLEEWIVIHLVNMNYQFADGLRQVYLSYPRDMRLIDGTCVWRKRGGSDWSKAVDEYRREHGSSQHGFRGGSPEGQSGEAGLEAVGVRSEAGQDEGQGKADADGGVSEAVPF